MRDSLAVRIVPLRQWLSLAPRSGFLPAGARQTVQLKLDASGLGSGAYSGRALIHSNDPVAPDTAIKVSFGVTGAPDISVFPATLEFGAHFIGVHDTLALTVANSGVDPLEVSGVRSSLRDFVVGGTPFRLLPGEATTLPVVFAPAEVADLHGALSLDSNDPDQPAAIVALHGVGSLAPVLETPRALVAESATNQLATDAARRERPLVVRNTGGAPLQWTATAYQGQIGARPQAVVTALPVARVEQVKGARGPGQDAAGDGGPDAFGYRWIDSDAPNGPVYAWEEIAGQGTRLFGSADDSTARIALPFPFSFYGRSYDSVSVCTNGFLSFVGRDSSFVNVDLPSAAEGVPRALVAPFWSDLDLRSVRGDGKAYAFYDGSKLIVEWAGAVHFAGAGLYTFQVFLWPSGAIEYQYKALGQFAASATVGIQDETGQVGLRVAYNVFYAHPDLRVRLSHQDDWLTLDRTAGTLPPGQSDTLRVRFDARQYRDGDYAGEVRIQSNDVAEPLVVVPCALHVGLITGPAGPQPGGLDAISTTPLIRFLLSPPLSTTGVVRGSSLRLNGQSVEPVVSPPARPTRGSWFCCARSTCWGAGRRSARRRHAKWRIRLGRLVRGGRGAARAAAVDERGPLPAFGTDPHGFSVRDDETIALTWSPPEGGADRDVAFSTDAGVRWSVLASGSARRRHSSPGHVGRRALVEVVARRGDAVLGTWLSLRSSCCRAPPTAAPACPRASRCGSRAPTPARRGRVSCSSCRAGARRR